MQEAAKVATTDDGSTACCLFLACFAFCSFCCFLLLLPFSELNMPAKTPNTSYLTIVHMMHTKGKARGEGEERS